jgi:hypothetical protein
VATFKNLREIQKHLESNAMEVIARSAQLERELANTMAQSAWEHVYDSYDPEHYDRREDEGGLVDTRNYAITDFGVKNGKAFLVFENLTQGNDNLSTIYLTDTIEEGIEANWNQSGEWSKPRRFVEETAKRLKENPNGMIDAIRKGLLSKGFKVK